jgi:hypothetical protein
MTNTNAAAETWEQRRDREDREKAIRDAKLTELVRFVAAEIDPRCTVRQSNYSPIITTPDGFEFHVSWDTYSGRPVTKLNVSGTYGDLYKFKPCNAKLPEINVSASRGAATIAKDIKRRFLPGLMEIVTKMRDAKDRTDSYNDKSVNNTRKLVDLSNGAFELNYKNEYSGGPRIDQPNASPTRIENFYGSLSVSGDSVGIELRSLTMDQAERIIRALARRDK